MLPCHAHQAGRLKRDLGHESWLARCLVRTGLKPARPDVQRHNHRPVTPLEALRLTGGRATASVGHVPEGRARPGSAAVRGTARKGTAGADRQARTMAMGALPWLLW